jgi:hypothetical protein
MTIRIDPREYPPESGESWWVIHPNYKNCEFRVPHGGITLCVSDFLNFKKGTLYQVDPCFGDGWIMVYTSNFKETYEMPEYLFARYFDANVFIVGRATPEELDAAIPFNYKPTIPPKEKKQLELFNDCPEGGLGE